MKVRERGSGTEGGRQPRAHTATEQALVKEAIGTKTVQPVLPEIERRA